MSRCVTPSREIRPPGGPGRSGVRVAESTKTSPFPYHCPTGSARLMRWDGLAAAAGRCGIQPVTERCASRTGTPTRFLGGPDLITFRCARKPVRLRCPRAGRAACQRTYRQAMAQESAVSVQIYAAFDTGVAAAKALKKDSQSIWGNMDHG